MDAKIYIKPENVELPEGVEWAPQAPTVTEADKYITISVAEYITLTKAAALLEVIMKDDTYMHGTVGTVKAVMQDMLTPDENPLAGADL